MSSEQLRDYVYALLCFLVGDDFSHDDATLPTRRKHNILHTHKKRPARAFRTLLCQNTKCGSFPIVFGAQSLTLTVRHRAPKRFFSVNDDTMMFLFTFSRQEKQQMEYFERSSSCSSQNEIQFAYVPRESVSKKLNRHPMIVIARTDPTDDESILFTSVAHVISLCSVADRRLRHIKLPRIKSSIQGLMGIWKNFDFQDQMNYA